jgi:hypothetical protein
LYRRSLMAESCGRAGRQPRPRRGEGGRSAGSRVGQARRASPERITSPLGVVFVASGPCATPAGHQPSSRESLGRRVDTSSPETGLRRPLASVEREMASYFLRVCSGAKGQSLPTVCAGARYRRNGAGRPARQIRRTAGGARGLQGRHRLFTLLSLARRKPTESTPDIKHILVTTDLRPRRCARVPVAGSRSCSRDAARTRRSAGAIGSAGGQP